MPEQQRTHWRNLFPSNYMGAHSFEKDETKVLQIARITNETLRGSDGKEDDCIVVHWANIHQELPLVLNKTNAENIATATGSQYVEDWPGKNVSLYVKQVKAFGEMKDAVRVGVQRPTDQMLIQTLKRGWMATWRQYSGEDKAELHKAVKAKKDANELTVEFLQNSIIHMIDGE